MEQKATIELTISQANAILALVDVAVRARGLEVADAALGIRNVIGGAFAPKAPQAPQAAE